MTLLKFLCHCRPDRSLFIHNYQFPVCSRCTGIYLSAFCFALFYIFSDSFKVFVCYNNVFLVSILMVIPCLVDGITQYMNLRESNNFLRVITGVLAGLGLMDIYTNIFRILINFIL